jgi:hypothetical protein
MSAPLRINQAPHLLKPGNTRPYYVFDRRLATKEWIITRLRNPAVRQIVRQKNVQRLVNSDMHNYFFGLGL